MHYIKILPLINNKLIYLYSFIFVQIILEFVLECKIMKIYRNIIKIISEIIEKAL